MSETMYEYYSKQHVLPTHAAFQSLADLERYDELRRNIFTQKLGLLPRSLRAAPAGVRT